MNTPTQSLKKFKVPYERISSGYFEVEAASKEEAIEKAEHRDGIRRVEESETKINKSKVEETNK